MPPDPVHAHDDHMPHGHDEHDHAGHAHGAHDEREHAGSHGGDHTHDDHAGHSHGIPKQVTGGWAFGVGIGLNLLFVLVEVVYGLLSRSMALVADAAHNLSDVLGLVLAWIAMWLARKAPTGRRTYGFRRSTILAALANGLLLVVAVGGVAWEALGRLKEPPAVEGTMVIAVAAIGVLINAGSAALFARGRQGDANVRGAFLHLAADAAVSLGVVISGFLLLKTGWWWIDPAMSLLVSVVVLWGTWSLLKEATGLAMDAVPDHIDPERVRSYLASLPGVEAVHDLHIWAMSTTETALTAHLALPWPTTPPSFVSRITHELEERFGIHHATIQFEPSEHATQCKQASEGAL